jgi:hypothetical protein
MIKCDCSSRNLYLTPLNRVVIADHNNEVFCEPQDILLATKEELSNGIQVKVLLKRLLKSGRSLI